MLRGEEGEPIAGLYAIGEAVDVTGWLGGYNFQWAWASGWAAGQLEEEIGRNGWLTVDASPASSAYGRPRKTTYIYARRSFATSCGPPLRTCPHQWRRDWYTFS